MHEGVCVGMLHPFKYIPGMLEGHVRVSSDMGCHTAVSHADHGHM